MWGHARTCLWGPCGTFCICLVKHLKPAICPQPLASWAAQIHAPMHANTDATCTMTSIVSTLATLQLQYKRNIYQAHSRTITSDITLITIVINRATSFDRSRAKLPSKWFWRNRSSFDFVAICSHEQDLTCLCVRVTHTILHLIDNNMIKEHVEKSGRLFSSLLDPLPIKWTVELSETTRTVGWNTMTDRHSLCWR